LVQTATAVRVQVVLHQQNLLRLGVIYIDQLFDTLRVVPPRPPVRHPDMTPTTQRLAHHEQVARPFALVLAIHLGALANAWRPRLAHLAEELSARFVEAHDRSPRVVGQHIGLDHVLHAPDELPVRGRWHAPGDDNPRVDVVFFRAWRTVSVLTFLTRPRA